MGPRAIAETASLSLREAGAQCEPVSLINPDQWDKPKVLARLRSSVIEWYVELQSGKPKTPSLSQLSFERRQVLKRREREQELSNITSGAEIIAYGCRVVREDRNVLTLCLGAVFDILSEFKTTEPENSSQPFPVPLREREQPIDLDSDTELIEGGQTPSSESNESGSINADDSGHSARSRSWAPDWSRSTSRSSSARRSGDRSRCHASSGSGSDASSSECVSGGGADACFARAPGQ